VSALARAVRRRRRGHAPEGEAPGIGDALLRVGLVLLVGYVAITLALGWWQVVQAGPLTDDPGNPMRQAAERNGRRGRILDSRGIVLAFTQKRPGTDAVRRYTHPNAVPVVGYKSLVFGTAGLEGTYDTELIGIDQLGPDESLLRKFRPDPSDPSDLYLSLDIGLQERAVRLLGDDHGAVVAIEPATGRVLALASTPSYDPNELIDATTGRSYLDALSGDDAAPLLDRATQGLYVPGSVFKMVTAAAAIDSGAIGADTTFWEQPQQSLRGYRVEGYSIRDAPRDVQLDHPLDFAEATEVSSNVYFAHVGLQVGPTDLLAWATRLGFGSAPAFDLPTVASQVNDGSGPLDGFADRLELASAAFGQGDVLVTPLQMALVAATIANDGVRMSPRLVDRLVSQNGNVRTLGSHEEGRAISEESARIITNAMVRAVEGPYAAGRAGGAAVEGVTTAGKSGSAELGGGQRAHSWFIGFAPADAPRIAIAVVVENAGLGSQRAVPLAGRLMAAYLARAAGR
jgi:penicillin-binding protein A